MPSLTGSVVLVTGANGGIGTELVQQALARGATKVYATARTPKEWTDDRIVPLPLDVTDTASRAAAVAAASDITVLINNAGAIPPTASLLDVTEADIRANFETNFFGPVLLARAFAPVLANSVLAAPVLAESVLAESVLADSEPAGRPGGVLVDVHSVASWYAFGGAYSASKAAIWAATNALRLELAPRGIHVIGVHMGYVDTAMAAHASGPKLAAADLVGQIYDAIEAGEYEVIGDALTARVKAGLAAPIEILYPELRAVKE